MNPMTQSKHSIMAGLQSAYVQINQANIDQIWFYGAGCIGQGAYQMTTFLRDQWPECQNLNVLSDLLAAARAVCNKQPGIVAITMEEWSFSMCSLLILISRARPGMGTSNFVRNFYTLCC